MADDASHTPKLTAEQARKLFHDEVKQLGETLDCIAQAKTAGEADMCGKRISSVAPKSKRPRAIG